MSVKGASWTLTAANTYSGSTSVSNGTLRIGSGGSLNPASAISVGGGSMVIASGGSLGAATVGVSGGTFTVASGATVGNAAISVTGGTFAAQPGSGTLPIGLSGSGSAGATLSVATGGAFSMVDGAIGTANLQQGSSFGGANTALTLSGGTLRFELSSSGADKLAVNVGAASVSGANTIAITALGSSLATGTYPLITAPGGLNGGTFQFAGGAQTAFVSTGSNSYQLSLNNSATSESVTVAPSTTSNIIVDTFGGADGTTIIGQTPNIANLPGGTWLNSGSSTVTYKNPNQITLGGTPNTGIQIATSGGSYTPPATLTVSAGLVVNNINSNGDPIGRGLGLGFFANVVPSGQVAEFAWTGGLTLDAAAGKANDGAGPGAVELDIGNGASTLPTRAVIIPFPTAVFGTFSTTATYTLSYSINTTTGQISNVSLSDGTTVDTADYVAIDNFDTTGVFTVANTAYVGIVNSTAGGATGFASNFILSSGPSAGIEWSGSGVVGAASWADTHN